MEKDSPSDSSTQQSSPPPQLQSTLMVTSLNVPQVSGATPTIASVCDRDAIEKIEKVLRQIVQENKGKKPGVFTEEWVKVMIGRANSAIAFRNSDFMLDLARELKETLDIRVPKTGAFWSDEKIGQEKAKDALGSSGQVLGESNLGEMARKFRLPPQRPKSKDGMVTESLDDFHERNRAALLFWGGVSKLYAEGLQGDVHVWLPKGLTMGSIFWNDELPMLRKLQKEERITSLWFHVRDEKSGDWSGNLTFDQLKIVDVYLMDARGVNKGAASLLNETKPSLKGTLEPKSYQMNLGTPIQIATLQAGFRNALARLRASQNLAKSPASATTNQ